MGSRRRQIVLLYFDLDKKTQVPPLLPSPAAAIFVWGFGTKEEQNPFYCLQEFSSPVSQIC